MMGRAGAENIDCQARYRALIIQRDSTWITQGSFRLYASPLLEIITGEVVSMVPVELSKTLLQYETVTTEICQQQ